jgi:hypothetical protein
LPACGGTQMFALGAAQVFFRMPAMINREAEPMSRSEAMKITSVERRTRSRTPRFVGQQVQLTYFSESAGARVTVPARLLDWTSDGWGVEVRAALRAGTLVSLLGESLDGAGGSGGVDARVVWCEDKGGIWRAGLAKAAPEVSSEPPAAAKACTDTDHYEVLQLSPNADPEMIHRVYRLLAQRYHPDNQETGNAETFKRVLEAYRTLGDPESRAAYDADYQAMRRLRWKIFDHPEAAKGAEAERRKRHGVLGLLYAKRLSQADQPSMSLFEIEDLLAVPREHLEFCCWYLKESGLVIRSDNGRYAITVRGVEEFERTDSALTRSNLLLGAAQPSGQATV